MRVKKKLKQLERRVRRLERTTPDLPPANVIRSRPIDTDNMWRGHVTDYQHGCDDEDKWNRNGYL